MPSGKHNSIAARTRYLISSLINVASSRDVPFHQLPQLQCFHHGTTFVSLWSPILSSEVTICGRHLMASMQHIKVAEIFFMLCLAYYVMKWVRYSWNWGVMVFTNRDMGNTFHEYIFRIFCNGWMDCNDAFHAVLCLNCCVMNRK